MLSGSSNPPTMSTADRLTESGYVYLNRYSWFKYLSYIRTIFGVITVFIAFSAGLDALFSISSAPLGVYLIVISIPMFLLEFGRIIRITGGSLCQVFSLVLDFDRWRRGLFYCTLAVVCFFPSIATVYGRVAGCFIFICGVLYVGKCFQKKKVSTFIVDPNIVIPPVSTSSSVTPRIF
uniref:COPI associated protein n=1 Tax=Panagrolaimus davidi TaxID=227884 RepID=A0A914QJK7_9BILA